MNFVLLCGVVLLFCIDYFITYKGTVNRNKDLTEKQRAHILSIKASITLFILSMYFNYKFMKSGFDLDLYKTNIENGDNFLLFSIVDKYDLGPDLSDQATKDEITELVFQKGKFDLNRNILEKIQKKEFDNNKFNEMFAKMKGNRPELEIQIGDRTVSVSQFVTTPGPPKSDFHAVDANGNAVAWISHKKGSKATDFGQWGGMSDREMKQVYASFPEAKEEILAFARDVRSRKTISILCFICLENSGLA